ncbi:MAG: rhodanese-like domain-containing protein [Planctomycetes bacterium]|nr:rhodanese-like domain-containing protein [Planctomycetota bacterium]
MPELDTLPIEISFEDAIGMKEVAIIDCRSTEEFEDGHLARAIHLPLQHLSIQIDDFPCSNEDTIFVYCRTGNRSHTFAVYLRSIGFTKCQSIAGGYSLWGEMTC